MSRIPTKVLVLNIFLLFILATCVPPTDEPEPLVYIPVETIELVDGETVTDANGISLSIPEGSAGDGKQVIFETFEAEGDLLDEIEQKYTLKSMFYHFAVQGTEDGVGWVELSFPTDDPNGRILAIVNGIYCFPLAEEPEEGQISVEALLGPEEASEHPVETLVPGGDVRYALVSPKSEMTAMQANQSTGLRFKEWANHFICVDDTSKISLAWLKTSSITREVGEAMLREIVRYRGDYAKLGFHAAKVTPKIYLRIIINNVFFNPAYAFQAKGMFLPDRFTYPFSDRERQAIYHELFHWIEDWKYELHPSDKNKQTKLWWLEVAAENGTFLVDPGNIELNAKTYGRRVNSLGGPLGVQMSVLDWAKHDAARYIHAQLFKVNMCDDHPLCTMSQQEFVDAINSGETPILDVTMCDSDSMDDYARYLLGLKPDLLNHDIPIHPTIANGTAIGDLLWSKRSTETSNDLSLVSALPNPPRVTLGTNELKVEARISPCAAYPLRVSNASTDPEEKSLFPSWPVALTVDPGTRVLYRLGNDEPKEHDGSRPLVLQPISENLGVPVVRVVGLGEESQDVTMKAKIATVDLSGDWIFDDYEIDSFTYSCDNPEITLEAIPNALKSLTTSMAQVGTFSQDEVNKLKYDLESGQSLEEGLTVDFTAVLKYDEIKVSANLTYVTPEFNENDTEDITFSKMEFLGVQDQSNKILWKLEEGRGTTTWTWVSKEKDDNGQEYDLHCNGKTLYKVKSGVYSEGASMYNQEGIFRSLNNLSGLKVKPEF
jgi:hypothetical protein